MHVDDYNKRIQEAIRTRMDQNNSTTDFPQHGCRNCGQKNRPQYQGTCNDGQCDEYSDRDKIVMLSKALYKTELELLEVQRRVRLQELYKKADAGTLTGEEVLELCKQGFQCCSQCTKAECGDNTNPAVVKPKVETTIETRIAEMERQLKEVTEKISKLSHHLIQDCVTCHYEKMQPTKPPCISCHRNGGFGNWRPKQGWVGCGDYATAEQQLCRCGHSKSAHYKYILNGRQQTRCHKCDPHANRGQLPVVCAMEAGSPEALAYAYADHEFNPAAEREEETGGKA